MAHQPEDRGSLQYIIKQLYQCNEKDWKKTETLDRFVNSFEEYYQSGKYNLYSDTYKFISENQDDGLSDYLNDRFELIDQKLDEKKSEHLKEFRKLCDYVSLEALRSINYNSIKITETEARGLLKETKELSKLVQEDRKNTSVQAVTVISIFTGIAMAFFGGFSMLSGALTSIQKNGNYVHIAIISLIIGFILFNTIYALIYAAGRVSGSPLTQKNHENCNDCNSHDTCKNKPKLSQWFHKFIRKYPYSFVINIIILGIMSVITVEELIKDVILDLTKVIQALL